MKAEKDFVSTMIGMIFIVLIGVAFFTMFRTEIMAIAESVFKLINKQFGDLPAGTIINKFLS